MKKTHTVYVLAHSNERSLMLASKYARISAPGNVLIALPDTAELREAVTEAPVSGLSHCRIHWIDPGRHEKSRYDHLLLNDARGVTSLSEKIVESSGLSSIKGGSDVAPAKRRVVVSTDGYTAEFTEWFRALRKSILSLVGHREGAFDKISMLPHSFSGLLSHPRLAVVQLHNAAARGRLTRVRTPLSIPVAGPEGLKRAIERHLPANHVWIKTTSDSGGEGVYRVKTSPPATVEAIAAEMAARRLKYPVVVEHDIENVVMSCAVQLVGSRVEPFGVVEQILEPSSTKLPEKECAGADCTRESLCDACAKTVYSGCAYPPVVRSKKAEDTMLEAAVEAAKYLDLRGEGGVDFVVDSRGDAWIVDVNFPRWNGGSYIRSWIHAEIEAGRISPSGATAWIAKRFKIRNTLPREFVSIVSSRGGHVPLFVRNGYTVVVFAGNDRDDVIERFQATEKSIAWYEAAFDTPRTQTE